MKRIFIGITVGIALVVAYWLISPLWRDIKKEEALPGLVSPAKEEQSENMTEETKQELAVQMEEMKDSVIKEDEQMPVGPMILKEATLIPSAHDVAGKVLLVQVGDTYFLRFEDLKTVNGPDLRIYLSSDLNVTDAIDLGPIRATEGSVNYELPPGTDLTKYKNALIWCRAFSVRFSYGAL